MPTFNNVGTLPGVVERVAALNLPIIIVNDGSADGTAAWLSQGLDRAESTWVLTHPKNLGKAAALQTGFAKAIELGCTHAVTMDTDGQLDPEDIPRLLEQSKETPRALVVGARDTTREDYPLRSKVGRSLSNLAIWLACRARVADSQCGLRVYPLQLIKEVQCDTERFGFEAAIITLAAWHGYPIVNVAVNCRYFPEDQRVSHFRPWRDSVHGVLLHMRLLLMKLRGKSFLRVEGDSAVEAEPTRTQP